MTYPKHPREFDEGFKRRIVQWKDRLAHDIRLEVVDVELFPVR